MSSPETPPGPGVPAPPAAPDGPPADAPSPEATPGAEPSLRRHLRGVWARTPQAVRWGALALAVLAIGMVAWPWLGGGAANGAVTDEDRVAAAARERAMWDAMLRLSPTPIEAGAVVVDALGPGDAERADGRYADYYAHDADSTAFSVVLTSAAFAPDLAVRLPDGRTVAASALRRTGTRAEVPGLVGPGRFEIVATSQETGAVGPYELSVFRPQPADSLEVDGPALADTLGAGPRRAGRFERAFGIRAEPDVPVVIRVVSAAFQPEVQLIGPNGVVREGATVELAAADSLFGAYVRFLPSFESAYRLEVTSASPGATGPFAIDARSIPVRSLRVDDRAVGGTLGPMSWLQAGRYVDLYRFRTTDDQRARLEVQSRAFPPGFRLWRLERLDRKDAADRPNERGASAVTFEGELAAGEYLLEVTSGGGDDAQPMGGEYVVRLGAEAIEPEPVPAEGGMAVPRAFATEVRRVGQSGGNSFEVGVTYVALSYPGSSRTRVQLSVTVRSIDYTGNWAPWESFAGQAYVVDDAGRRYTSVVAESASPSGPRAEPGTARRGTVVFYHPTVVGGQKRLVLVASVGRETVTLPIPVD